MSKLLLLLGMLVVAAFSQSCSSVSAPIDISNATVSSSNATVAIVDDTGSIKWANCTVNDTLILTVSGWSSNNGTLVELRIGGPSLSYTASIGNNQLGVITSTIPTILTYDYTFAQKDDANSDFQVQLTSNTTKTLNSTLDFVFILRTREYNSDNCTSNCTCSAVCGSGLGVKFFVDAAGNTVPTQFVCWSSRLLVSFVIVLLGLLI